MPNYNGVGLLDVDFEIQHHIYVVLIFKIQRHIDVYFQNLIPCDVEF